LATVLFLFGEEESTLWATLDTVHVIVEVKKGDGKGDGTHNDTIHLARTEGVSHNESNKNHLDDGHLGHDEPILNSHNLNSGFRGGIHRLFGVTWHFYYIQRN
jgi:hypothetical protein